MGAFGADLQKPIRIWGNAPWLQRLVRLRPENLSFAERAKFYTIDLDGAVTGHSALAFTRTYTRQFCEAVIRAHLRSLPKVLRLLAQQDVADEGEDSCSSIDLDCD